MTCNVLVTAGSRRVPLVRAFRRALRLLGVRGRVVVTDVNPLSPAVHVADRAYRVPMADDPAYVPEVLAVCAQESIRLAIPTIDDELMAMGRARATFAAAGVLLACSSEATAALCNDKFALCAHLAARGVPAARSYLPGALPADAPLPLFIKPRVGRGAVGAFPVRTRRELDFFLDYVPNPVVQEYLDSPEYTIDVLCDRDGRPLAIVPRERVVIRAGVTDRGRTVRSRVLLDLAEAVCAAVRFAGPLNVQCRMRGDDPAVIEINPRFSGGIPLTIAAGADFPAMLVGIALGRPVERAIGAFRDQLWMTNYDSALFLEASRLQLHRASEATAASAGEVA